MEVNPFTINVPNEVLNDLRRLKGRSEGILIQTIPLRHEI